MMTGRLGQLPVVAIALVVAATIIGCGGNSPVALTDRGCAQIVLGVQGRVDPGSSGLSCDGVKQVIGGSVPATPGGYLLKPEPDVTWKCRMYPSGGDSPNLLTCAHGGKAFAIRRVSS